MASRTIEIVLKATNAMFGGIASAFKDLKKFGSGVWDFGKKAAIGLLGVGTALAGIAVKAIASFAGSEDAVNSLTSALRLHGDEVEKNLDALKKRAAAIQDETGASDDATIATMARLRTLGVEVTALDAAAKGVVALKNAGLDEAAAEKAVAMAHAGQFGALSRYIPALKNATDEAQKAAIVNDFLTKGYAASKGKLESISGAYRLFKERVGDVWEEMGNLINQVIPIQPLLMRLAAAMKRVGETIAEWAAGDTVKRLREDIEGLLAAISEGGSSRTEALKALGEFITASFWLGAEKAANVLKEAAGDIGVMIGRAAKAAMQSVATEKRFNEAEKQLVSEGKIPDRMGRSKLLGINFNWFGRFTDDVKNEFALIERRMAENDRKAILGETYTPTTGTTPAEIRFETALQNLERIAKEARARSGSGTSYSLPPNFDDLKNQFGGIKVAQEKEKSLDFDKEEKRILGEINDLTEEQIALTEQRIKQREELAKKTVAEFIADQRKIEARAKESKDEEDKYNRLKNRASRMSGNGKLSKADQEFMRAFENLRAEKQGLALDKAKLEQLQKERDQVQRDIKKASQKTAESIEDALTFDGAG